MSRKIKVELTLPQADALLDASAERLAGEVEAKDKRVLERARAAIIEALET